MEFFRWIAGLFRFRQTNWKAVFLCLTAAVVFWFFSALNKENTSDLDLPVQLVIDESRYVATGPVPDRVWVNVTGKGWDLLNKRLGLRAEPVIIRLEQPDRTSFLLTRTLMKDLSASAEGLRINFIHGDTLHLQYDRLISRKIRLECGLSEILFDDGFGLTGEVTIDPAVVEVSGPADSIRKLGGVYRIPVKARGLSKTLETKVAVFGSESPLMSDPTRVDVRVPAGRVKRMVIAVPVKIDALVQRWATDADSSRIEVEIPQDQLTDFDARRLRVTMVIRKPAADRFYMRGQVSGLPEFSRILRMDTLEVYRIKP